MESKDTTKRRVDNYGLWLALLALLPNFLKSFGIELPETEYDSLIYAVLTFLVAAGVVSNPTTNNKWFLDDKKDDVK